MAGASVLVCGPAVEGGKRKEPAARAGLRARLAGRMSVLGGRGFRHPGEAGKTRRGQAGAACGGPAPPQRAGWALPAVRGWPKAGYGPRAPRVPGAAGPPSGRCRVRGSEAGPRRAEKARVRGGIRLQAARRPIRTPPRRASRQRSLFFSYCGPITFTYSRAEKNSMIRLRVNAASKLATSAMRPPRSTAAPMPTSHAMR